MNQSVDNNELLSYQKIGFKTHHQYPIHPHITPSSQLKKSRIRLLPLSPVIEFEIDPYSYTKTVCSHQFLFDSSPTICASEHYNRQQQIQIQMNNQYAYSKILQEVRLSNQRNKTKCSTRRVSLEQCKRIILEHGCESRSPPQSQDKSGEQRAQNIKALDRSSQALRRKLLAISQTSIQQLQQKKTAVNERYQELVQKNQRLQNSQRLSKQLRKQADLIDSMTEKLKYERESRYALLIKTIREEREKAEKLTQVLNQVRTVIKEKEEQHLQHQRRLQEIRQKREEMKQKNYEMEAKTKALNSVVKEQEEQIGELEQDFDEVDKEVAVMRVMAQKDIICGFDTFDNLGQILQNFDVYEWSDERTLTLTFNQIKVWVLGRLYPLNNFYFKVIPTTSPVSDALFFQDQSKCTPDDFKILDKCLFQNVTTKKPNRVINDLKYLAFGSESRDLMKITFDQLEKELLNFKGYFLEIKAIEVGNYPNQPQFSYFIVHYQFYSQPYSVKFFMIDLKDNMNHESIDVLISPVRRKGKFGASMTSLLKQARRGIISLEIPKLYSESKKGEYDKLFNLLSSVK